MVSVYPVQCEVGLYRIFHHLVRRKLQIVNVYLSSCKLIFNLFKKYIPVPIQLNTLISLQASTKLAYTPISLPVGKTGGGHQILDLLY